MGFYFYSQQLFSILIVFIFSKNVYAINEAIFNVMDFGAAANGEKDDSEVREFNNDSFFFSLFFLLFFTCVLLLITLGLTEPRFRDNLTVVQR